ncbi:MAG: EF-hand domain-containing protein [Planktotalea sp.]|uniref:hypothetical protein n=1 Tax=Planktotalea sp. TaxID=2029877 RepID=UPI003C712621
MLKNITLATALVAFATSAFAAIEADTNEDGLLSFEEISAAYADVTEDQFSDADVDGDGLLDESEVADAVEAGLLNIGE